MKKALVAIALAMLVACPVRAQWLDLDLPNLAGVLSEIEKIDSQIKQMSEVVGAAREQVQTLQQVSAGIRNLEKVISGGVQGILGSVSDELGLKDVFAVGKELQSTVTDGIELYKSAKALPVEAKAALKDIGLAVDDVEKYLAHGVVYDAFQGMDIADWRKIFKDPVKAFANGTVGRACVISEAYLDTSDLRTKYVEKIASMSNEEKARLSGVASIDMAALNLYDWQEKLEKRVAKSLNYGLVADKLVTASGSKASLTETTQVGNAIAATSLKQQVDAVRDADQASSNQGMALAAQSDLMAKKMARETYDDAVAAAVTTP